MDLDLINTAIGSDGKFDLAFKDGKLMLEVDYTSVGMTGKISLEIPPGYFIDKLAEAIPGKIDDAVLAIIKGAFGV